LTRPEQAVDPVIAFRHLNAMTKNRNADVSLGNGVGSRHDAAPDFLAPYRRIDPSMGSLEDRLRSYEKSEVICGVDEAGRGPLAGPVFAAAVILDPAKPIHGLRDSKKLTEARREALAIQIKRDALAWSVAQCSEAEIDAFNILQATMLAMRRAIESLSTMPTLALIDGNRCPVCMVRTEAIVKGDDKVPAISAASILAKTARDAALAELHRQYPNYAFDQHKGYPTALHLELLKKHGVSPAHRKSYAPIRALLASVQMKESTE
jgi:ribonuclease HII